MRWMNAQSTSSGNATAGSSGGLHKGKACLFVVLVAIAVLCVCLLLYMLFYAGPRANTTIRNTGHSLVRQTVPSISTGPAVRS